MIIRPFFLLICVLGGFASLFSQDFSAESVSPNGVYLEGYLLRHDFNNGFLSLNYERNFGERKGIAARIGIYPDFESLIAVPVTVSKLTAPLKAHHFEFGIGAVYRVEYFEERFFHDIPALMIPLMYRFQKEKGFFVRAGINLWVSFPTLPAPSLSAGYKF
ncbi:MAG: hypothetical protein AAF587_37435 [Bacteroidota bacterium]